MIEVSELYLVLACAMFACLFREILTKGTGQRSDSAPIAAAESEVSFILSLRTTLICFHGDRR